MSNRKTIAQLVILVAAVMLVDGCNRDTANRAHAPRCSRTAERALDLIEDTTRDHAEARCNVTLKNTSEREIVVERARLLHHPVAGAVGADDSWQGFVRLAIAAGKTHRIGQACGNSQYLVIAAYKDDLFDPATGDEMRCFEEFQDLSLTLREGLCEGADAAVRARSDQEQDYNCRR
jgi:hypothetical protein